MLAISLIFVGITLILNGILLWNKKDLKVLFIINLFTGFMVLLFNLYSILVGDPSKMVGYMGGILFGLTNILIAFELIFDKDKMATGWYCFLATICAVVISIFYFATGDILKGISWFVWSFIWLFGFISFAITQKFEKTTLIMFIVQGIITTGGFGLLQLFKIISF